MTAAILTGAAIALLAACQGGGSKASPTPAGGTPSMAATASGGGSSAAPQAAASAAGCHNLPADPAVKAAVVVAYRHEMPVLHHVAVGHPFFYGECGGARYAVARFAPTKGATTPEQVAFQDDGAAMKYFVLAPGGHWAFAGSDSFPAAARGCAASGSPLPRPLTTLWGDCHTH